MTTAEHATRPEEHAHLINGRWMTCPRCRVELDLLAFTRFGQIEAFARETVPIYKCPKKPSISRGGEEVTGCGWIFAPGDVAVAVSVLTEGLMDELLERAREVDRA